MSIGWLVWCDTKQVLSISQFAAKIVKKIKNDCVAEITLSLKHFSKRVMEQTNNTIKTTSL